MPNRRLIIDTRTSPRAASCANCSRPYNFHVQTLKDIGEPLDVVEDGDTFAANARKKAIEQARHLGAWVLADDSGLEVDALGGRPGIFSARYAGESATVDNNARLLEELGDLPIAGRTARYYCHVAVADPRGEVRAEVQAFAAGGSCLNLSARMGLVTTRCLKWSSTTRLWRARRRVKAAISHRRAPADDSAAITRSGSP